jgi:hypothetical protein
MSCDLMKFIKNLNSLTFNMEFKVSDDKLLLTDYFRIVA